jgi:hypothetical protein
VLRKPDISFATNTDLHEALAAAAAKLHIVRMTIVAKRTARKGSAKAERVVVYRGIKIAPITGKRSAIAKAIRDALRARSEEPRAQPALT